MAPSENPSTLTARRGSTAGERDRTVVWVVGEHDIATRLSLATAIARAARCDDVDVLVDLSGVTFMDASTVGAIVESAHRLISRGQSLEVRAPSGRALRVLELCALTHLIHRDSVRSSAGAALGTWVDVAPNEPTERIDHEATPVTATTRQSVEPATADLGEALVIVGMDRGGP